jgi:hypothetical protein
MILDGVSNDNEIAWNLNHHQYISRRTHLYDFFLFLRFFSIYLKIHCQDCQNNPSSSDPHPIMLDTVFYTVNISFSRDIICSVTSVVYYGSDVNYKI